MPNNEQAPAPEGAPEYSLDRRHRDSRSPAPAGHPQPSPAPAGPRVQFEPLAQAPAAPASASAPYSEQVDANNAYYTRHPEQGDAPPRDEAPQGASFYPEPAPRKKGGVRRFVDFWVAPPDAGKKRGSKASKGGGANAPAPAPASAPVNPDARRGGRQKRSVPLGARYGGGRAKWTLVTVGATVFVLTGPLALIVAANRPTDADVQAAVQAALADAGQAFPSGQAVAWVGPVVREWATYDEERTDEYEQRMSPYLSQGMDSRAGWNGRGTQTVIDVVVDPEPVPSSESRAVVNARYLSTDGAWRCVAVPVFTYKPAEMSDTALAAFALAGNPTPIGCNPRTGAPALDAAAAGLQEDNEAGQTLATDFFPGFFAAWAASDANALRQYTASGVTTLGLGGAMASVPAPTIGEVSVLAPEGEVVDGEEYVATVPVTWTVGGTSSQVTAFYDVPVRRDGDRWFVTGEPTATVQAPDVNGRGPESVPQPGDGVTGENTYNTPPAVEESGAPQSLDTTTSSEEDANTAEQDAGS